MHDPAPHPGAPGAGLAARLAQAFLNNAYQAWRKTGNMFEKFNVLRERLLC